MCWLREVVTKIYYVQESSYFFDLFRAWGNLIWSEIFHRLGGFLGLLYHSLGNRFRF